METLPPEVQRIYEQCKKQFGVSFEEGLMLAYSPHIYTMIDMTPDQEWHERHHIIQQDAVGVVWWWQQYLQDEGFRLREELEAYHEQFAFYLRSQNDRNKIYKFRNSICKKLSSGIYGNIISYTGAMAVIK